MLKTKNPKIADYLIYLPAMGSILAVSCDVGYFYAVNINFYTLFSLSDHILFSLQYFPLALVAVCGMALVMLVALRSLIFIGRSIIDGDENGQLSTAHRRSRLKLTLVLLVLAIISNGTLLYFDRSITTIITVSTFSLPVVFYLIAPNLASGPQFLFLAYLIVALAMSFTFGLTLGEASKESKKFTSAIETSKNLLNVRFLRSGEKGVLFVEEQTKRISFLVWSEVKGISAP